MNSAHLHLLLNHVPDAQRLARHCGTHGMDGEPGRADPPRRDPGRHRAGVGGTGWGGWSAL